MITSIRIDDNKKTPFKYIPKIKAFKNGSEFIFKPGVNVIVGKNGSGGVSGQTGAGATSLLLVVLLWRV